MRCMGPGSHPHPSPLPSRERGPERRARYLDRWRPGVAVGLECDLSAYDAEFVVLARTLGVRLVTLNGGILEGGDVAAGLTGRGNSVGHGEYSAF